MTSAISPSKLDLIMELLERDDLPVDAIAEHIGSPVPTTTSLLWMLYKRQRVVPMARDGADWWGIA